MVWSHFQATNLRVLGEQGAGSNSEDGPPTAATYQPGQGGEPEPVRGLVTYRGRQLSPKDCVLVSQHKQLGVLRQLAMQLHRWDGQQLPGHLEQQRHDHPDMLSTHRYRRSTSDDDFSSCTG